MGFKITQLTIHEIVADDEQAMRNYRWATSHHNDINNYEQFTIEGSDEDHYEIRVYMKDYYRIQEVMIHVDGQQHVDNFHCDCKFHRNFRPCGHVLATLMFCEASEIREIPFDIRHDYEQINEQKERRYEQLMQQMKQDRMRQQQKNEERLASRFIEDVISFEEQYFKSLLNQNSYMLQFEILNNSRHTFEIQVKIGDGEKFYIVKNINQLLQQIEQKEYVSYGKFIGFYHDLTSFDELTQKAIYYMQVSKAQGQEYTYGYASNPRYFELSGAFMDDFFNLLHHGDDIYTTQVFEEEEIMLHLCIMKEENAYLIYIQRDEINFCIGEQYLYKVNPDKVVRCICSEFSVMKKFISFFDNQEYMRLSEDMFFSFQKYVLHPLKEYIQIEEEHLLLTYYEEDKLLLFSDLKRDELQIRLDAIYANQEVKNALDPKNVNSLSLEAKRAGLILKQFVEDDMILEEQDYTIRFHTGDDGMYDFLEVGIPQLQEYCDVYISDTIKNLMKPKPVNIEVGVHIEHDLLEMKVDASQIDRDELYEILRSYKRKKRYHRLKNGEIVSLQDSSLKEVSNVFEDLMLPISELKKNHIEMPLFRSFQVENSLESKESLATMQTEQYLNFLENIHEQKVMNITIASSYTAILREYQQYGVKWLLLLTAYGFGGILADDMGLGKTLQAIAYLESLDVSKNPSLIVTPASLMLNWEDEFHKFSSKLKVLCIHGNQQKREMGIQLMKDYDVIITTYDYMKRDITHYQDKKFQAIILDEGQYIKNHNTLAAKAVKQLHGNHRLVLTGTPIENSLAELWSLFDFLMPNYLYNYHYFKTNYESPIIKDSNEAKIKKLKKLVQPFILRRTKKEVLRELPDKIEKRLVFDFRDEEYKLYVAKLSQINIELRAQLQMDDLNKVEVLKMLMELRQICCEPRMLYNNIYNTSSKLHGCMELIESLVSSNKKILLFSSFTKTLDLIARELDEKHISYYMLTGSTSKKDRRELVAKFQEDKTSVFLISLKAGGTGLNLTAAEAVIHYDPWWNQSAQNQATDRAHRIGQEHVVEVFQLIMKDSIEERIMLLQEKKRDISDMFIEQSEGSIASMNKDDILDLFTM